MPCFTCRPFATFFRRLTRHPDAVVGLSRFVLAQHLAQGLYTDTPIQDVVCHPYALPDGKTPIVGLYRATIASARRPDQPAQTFTQ